jgi:arginyl-tRNA synthetase
MTHYETILSKLFIEVVQELYHISVEDQKPQIIHTLKTFAGDYTIVLFPYVKSLKESPDSIGEKIGSAIKSKSDLISNTNVIKGFLNIEMSPKYWNHCFLEILNDSNFGVKPKNGEKVMVEFSSPNTNKPLHLGHIRNILLGWSCSKIYEANGYEVVRVQIINDRGIAICKSMLAWQLYGNGSTPESKKCKADHFVGDFYVLFEEKFQEEYKLWQDSEVAKKIYDHAKVSDKDQFFKEFKNTYFNEYSLLGKAAKEMLVLWERHDSSTIELWKKMNGWVYEGFNETYAKLGVRFDKLYYESDTYLLGKDIVNQGLKKDVFYKKDDGSVWIDLTDVGLDHKVVLRKDGTSVYITQDIGTAQIRYKDFGCKKMIYTVADEQDYHFKVLFEIMKRLGEEYASGLYHLSYGMVDLPTGRMKSREGTVVDADDLIDEVIKEATATSEERGEISEMSPDDQHHTINKIALAALKYFIIKVQPKVRMIFNPQESVDMQGQTGPYIQNAFVRIKSVLRKNEDIISSLVYNDPKDAEKELIKLLIEYPAIVELACKNHDPSEIAKYCYSLAKEYHRFYHEVRILNAESIEAKSFRIDLSTKVGSVLQHGMDLLGIEMPEKM